LATQWGAASIRRRHSHPEEECSVAIVVVDAGNKERAADIATGLVQLEGRARLASVLREVVVGVVVGVAVELVDFAWKSCVPD